MPDTAATDPVSLPHDLEDVRLQLDAAGRAAAALAGGLDDEQINWQPSPAVWSIAQCLDHLNAGSRVYLAAMRDAEAVARRHAWRRRGPIQPGWPSRWFIRQLEPPPRIRMRAPGKIAPAPRAARSEVAGEFARQQAQVRELLFAAADLDLNRARFRNPFLAGIRFSLGTGFLVIAAHQRRHLWQAARLRERPDFGDAGGAHA
jgi:hypothetical protein